MIEISSIVGLVIVAIYLLILSENRIHENKIPFSTRLKKRIWNISVSPKVVNEPYKTCALNITRTNEIRSIR